MLSTRIRLDDQERFRVIFNFVLFTKCISSSYLGKDNDQLRCKKAAFSTMY